MKSWLNISLFTRIFLIIGIGLLISPNLFAQIDVSMTQAVALQTTENINKWQIFVKFNKGITIPQHFTDFNNPKINLIKDPKNYSLIEIETGQRIDVIYIFSDSTPFYTGNNFNNAGLPGAITVFLDPSIRLDPKKHYHLYVLNVLFEGKTSNDPPQKSLTFAKSITAGNNVPTPETDKKDNVKDSLSFTAADGRDDSNIYISGEAIASKGNKPNFSADIKVEIPFRKIIGNRIHNFNPFFELKAGQGPDVDPDTMKLGLNWEFPAWRYGGDNLQLPIRRILLKNAPQIEAEKDWDNVNFVIDTRLRFVSRTYSSKNVTFYFRPFIGQEFGKNINLVFPVQKAGIHDVSFEGEYTRRWLLRREIYFEKTDDNGLQPLQIGKGPRDYLLTKFNLNFTKSFGLSLSYENGRLPPSFKTVNQKISFGLTYKIKLE
jgi:hypothetical protein